MSKVFKKIYKIKIVMLPKIYFILMELRVKTLEKNTLHQNISFIYKL